MRKTNSDYERFDAVLARERLDVFNESARQLGASVQAIEKDFWVCRTIDAMFKGFGPSARPKLYFKGGTSLSKGYGLIRRFSEDIDIVVSRKGLGIPDAQDPLRITSSDKRKAVTKDATAKCRAFVGGRMKAKLQDLLPEKCAMEMDPADTDCGTLKVRYPSLLPENGYISPWVKIEAGARGAITPCAQKTIRPYIQDALGQEWNFATPAVALIEAERTFLEKVLILHASYCRLRDNPDWKSPDRNHSSRHYYDIAMMRDTKVGFAAMRDDALLDDVRSTKLKMFPAAGDKLKEAIRGGIHLVPQPTLRSALAADYESMTSMMFSNPPTFDWVMEQIAMVETQMNVAAKAVA